MTAVEPVATSIPARDGYRLGATIYPAEAARGTVLINAATGVPHRFYGKLATYLAESGYTTVAYDYRGIGASAPESLRGFPATLTDWALLDLAGAVDWAADRERLPLFLIGHSFGGQVAGLLDDAGRVSGMVTLSSQSGYWRLQGGEQKLVVAASVYLALPLLARTLGYAPWSRFARGEDLPRGVALQWSAWCRRPEYLLADRSLPLERFDQFVAPVLAYSFSDDKWGTARAVDAMMRAYPNLQRRHVIPAEVGLPRLGHMGYFRAPAQPLWSDLVDWFNSRLRQQ